ncbi:MAG: type II toxin-antitoxin system prevent-host-death family antitoxin [Hyphomonadaceae bacterium]|nr:type II toxin-antitoxin system prevent-host-death family antitoxin [Hyphomonadaceae bacterium]
MVIVGAYEAKTRLAALLDRVAAGEDVIITRHGRPIARLTQAGAAARSDVDAAIEALKAARIGVTAGPGGWKALRDYGRR